MKIFNFTLRPSVFTTNTLLDRSRNSFRSAPCSDKLQETKNKLTM